MFGYDPKGNLTTIANALNEVTTITVKTQAANEHDLPGRNYHNLQLGRVNVG
jgi:hypothetical protein